MMMGLFQLWSLWTKLTFLRSVKFSSISLKHMFSLHKHRRYICGSLCPQSFPDLDMKHLMDN